MIKTITLVLYLTSDLHSAPVLTKYPMDTFETCIEEGTKVINNVVITAPPDVEFVTAFACEIKMQRTI